MRASLAGKLLALGLAAAFLTAGGTSLSARPAPESFAPLVKELSPAVVNISTTKEVEGRQSPFSQLPPGHPLRDFFEDFMGKQPESRRKLRSLGSGFLIDPDGYIVTNHHVIAEADKVTVLLDDDTKLDAKVIGSDEKTDLALLKVDADRKLPSVDWGQSRNAEVGDWSLAIGNPFGLGGTVTAGIISARGRDINAGPYSRFIQTDTAINQGNSGGPLFNMDGKVIGVNTAILSPGGGGNVGVGFALPSRVAQPIIEELRENGEVTRGWLGVTVQPVTPELADGLGLPSDEGALVSGVVENSPADKAGLTSGDVVVAFDGETVEDAGELAWRTSQSDPGSTATLGVMRDGSRMEVTVTLGDLDKREQAGVTQKVAARTAKALGLKLAAPEPQVLEEFGLPANTQGAVVVRVARGGPAASRGIRPGDVIARVGQQDIDHPKDVHEIVAEALDKDAKGLVMLVQRGNSGQFVSVPLAKPGQG